MVLATTKYRRVLLKVSGEVMGGKSGQGIDFAVLRSLCKIIKKLRRRKVQLAIVIGGGNFWRYRDFVHSKLDRVNSDHLGMLATIMNSVALQDELLAMGVDALAVSALPIEGMVPPFDAAAGRKWLEDGGVLICGGGTGNPFCSTDMAAALRAGELQCKLLIKATNVDYVYDSDPKKNPKAKALKNLSYHDVISKKLGVMDFAAIATAAEISVPIAIFNLQKPENLLEIFKGKRIGTLIH